MLPLRPRDFVDVWQAIENARQRVTEFAPDLVVVFGADHWTGLHGRCMPPFSIIVDGQTIADEGGFAGQLTIEAEQALALARHIDRHHVDVATARHFRADHGISQVLHQLFVDPENVNVLPIIINCVAEPLPSFTRCQALGDAVGSYLSTVEGRVLVIASGGLSHDVAMLFPQIGLADSDDRNSYLVDGPTSQLGLAGWTEHIRQLTKLGNEWMVTGDLHSPIATSLDEAFLTALTTGDDSTIIGLEERISNEGGSGMAEVRTWIAASHAFRTVTGKPPVLDLYRAPSNLGLGFATAHA